MKRNSKSADRLSAFTVGSQCRHRHSESVPHNKPDRRDLFKTLAPTTGALVATFMTIRHLLARLARAAGVPIFQSSRRILYSIFKSSPHIPASSRITSLTSPPPSKPMWTPKSSSTPPARACSAPYVWGHVRCVNSEREVAPVAAFVALTLTLHV